MISEHILLLLRFYSMSKPLGWQLLFVSASPLHVGKVGTQRMLLHIAGLATQTDVIMHTLTLLILS